MTSLTPSRRRVAPVPHPGRHRPPESPSRPPATTTGPTCWPGAPRPVSGAWATSDGPPSRRCAPRTSPSSATTSTPPGPTTRRRRGRRGRSRRPDDLGPGPRPGRGRRRALRRGAAPNARRSPTPGRWSRCSPRSPPRPPPGGRSRPPLVIVESTLTPGTVEELLLPIATSAGLEPGHRPAARAGPAPRLVPRRGLRTARPGPDLLRRGGPLGNAARDVLGLMCDTLHRAPSHIEGELVKCVENAYRHVEITLANQLSLAYAHVDMVEVLRLAGTKWNIGTFHPSFGTGGYCIPLSSRYLLRGAADATSALAAQRGGRDRRPDARPGRTGRRARRPGAGPRTRVQGRHQGRHAQPHRRDHRGTARAGRSSAYTTRCTAPQEIEALLGPGTAATTWPGRCRGVLVLIVPDHPEFLGEPYLACSSRAGVRPLLILDNHGVWEGRTWPGHVAYRRAGGTSWLDVPASVAADAR